MLRPLLYRALNSFPLAGFRRDAYRFGSALPTQKKCSEDFCLSF